MNLNELASVVVYDYLWGLPLVLFVLFTGIFFTFRSKLIQFRYLKTSFKAAKKSVSGSSGDGEHSGVISSFEAMSMALGTTIGVGNIGGVAAAIALGGPGAIFWMWVAGLFGMVIKTTEITLALFFRSKEKNGEAYGGPNYYIHKGIGIEKGWVKFAKFLNFIFAFGFIMGIFLNIQTYTVSEAVGNTFNLNLNIVGIVYTVLLYIMISGGMKQLGKIASFIVPLMCIFYIVGSLFIIFKHSYNIIPALELIFKSAFTGTAAMGGFVGASFKLAITSGMSRSVFSNEAGWGTAPMIHASAKVDHPFKQGVLGIFEVIFDTLIICTLTAMVIMVSGEWNSGLDGATLTLQAFESGVGNIGRMVLAVGVFFFGLTTSSGVYTQIEVVLRYVLGEKPLKDKLLQIYKWFYPIPSLAMVLIATKYGLPGTTLWLFSDASTALPIFANLIALIILFPIFKRLVGDYEARFLGKGEKLPDNEVFYEE